MRDRVVESFRVVGGTGKNICTWLCFVICLNMY